MRLRDFFRLVGAPGHMTLSCAIGEEQEDGETGHGGSGRDNGDMDGDAG